MRTRFLLPNSMPLPVHLCLAVAPALLLLLSSPTSCLGTQYQDCLQDTFNCGGFDFRYPFGKIDSGCGEPDFQLQSCEPNGPPRINISGNRYRILEFSSLDYTMTIVDDNMWDGKCKISQYNYSELWWSNPYFKILPEYSNIMLFKYCNKIHDNYGSPGEKLNLCGDDWYYILSPEVDQSLAPGAHFCMAFQLPIKNIDQSIDNLTLLDEEQNHGIGIRWHVDQSIYERCRVCRESNGSCGYSTSEPFLCYCSDETSHRHKCTSDGGRERSIIIGCSIGGAALIAIAVLLFFMFYAQRRKQPPPLPRSSISKVEKFLKEYACEMPTRYSKSDLKKMTNNFAEMLGEGGFGVVYKGKLRNGALVAVKLLDRHRHNESAQFVNEVATIGRIHHVNLVRLLGYCFESPTSALVYEYMVNGSLEKFIFAGKRKGQILRWEQLYSIALGAARGIAYLHQDCEKRIIHFDIKPHNILLDSDFTPKVADFGLAKHCRKGDDHISMTGARGTPGYVAPEVWSRDLGPVTDKSDVYSFGMLLLEIVGGRKNIEVQVSRSSQLYFPEWAFKLLESGELETRLRGGELEAEDEEKAKRVTKIGLWCIQYKSTDRPCMNRVVQMLEGNGDDVTIPPLPFTSSAEPERPLPSSVETSSIEIGL